MAEAADSTTDRGSRGKLAVGLMLGLGCLAAFFAWWWNWERTQKCLAFYGGSGASLIRTATQVELLVLSSADTSEATPQMLDEGERHDLSAAPGLIHARTALLDDRSYLWQKETGDCRSPPRYAVRFVSGDRQATLVFDFDCGRVRYVEGERSVAMTPKISAGWQSFISRNASQPAVSKPKSEQPNS